MLYRVHLCDQNHDGPFEIKSEHMNCIYNVNTTVWQIHLDFYSGCYLQLMFWYIHDDVVQTLPILDRQYQMLFYFLSFVISTTFQVTVNT
jgi:hypothetical protein